MYSPVPHINDQLEYINATEESIFDLQEQISLLIKQEKIKSDSIAKLSLKINQKNEEKSGLLTTSHTKSIKSDSKLNDEISNESNRLQQLEQKLSILQRKYEIVDKDVQNFQKLSDNLNIHLKSTQTQYHSLLEPKEQAGQSNIVELQAIALPDQIRSLNDKILATQKSISSLNDIKELITSKLSILKQTRTILDKEIHDKQAKYEESLESSPKSNENTYGSPIKSKFEFKSLISTQEKRNNALQNEINNADSQIQVANNLIRSKNNQISKKNLELQNLNSEISTTTFQLDLLRKRAPPITNNLLNSLTESKISIFQKTDRLEKELEETQDQQTKIQTKLENLSQKIEHQGNISKKLDEIEQKIYKLKSNTDDNTLEIKMSKELKMIELDIEEQQKEAQKLQQIILDSLDKPVELPKVQYETDLEKDLKKILKQADATKYELEYLVNKKKYLAKQIKEHAKKIYEFSLMNTELNTSHNSDLYELSNICRMLRSKIKEKAREIRAKLDYLDTRNDTLKMQIADYGHYDERRDVFVLVDDSLSEISKDFTFSQSFFRELLKQLAIFDKENIDYNLFLNKYSKN